VILHFPSGYSEWPLAGFGSHSVLVEVRLPRRAKYQNGGYSIC
jgi:hypothetical protein